MHPFLTKLGIRAEVQEFFAPYYAGDQSGNLVFPYGRQHETYGMAFHYVPTTENCWQAGSNNLAFIREAFICGSAMEAIAWLHIHFLRSPRSITFCLFQPGTSPALNILDG